MYAVLLRGADVGLSGRVAVKDHALAAAYGAAATLLLFAGPSAQWRADGGDVAGGAGALAGRLRSAPGVRDLLIAPLTEELAFRGAVCGLLRRGGWSARATKWLSPLAFGVAHLHHFRDLRARGLPAARAALAVGLQFSYTTVFGWLAAHLLGATGSLAAPVAAHVLANHFGLPDFAGAGGRPAVMLAYVIGVGAFAALLRRGPFVL